MAFKEKFPLESVMTPVTNVESWELKRLTVAYSSGPSVSISIILPFISGSAGASISVALIVYDDINKVRSIKSDVIFFIDIFKNYINEMFFQ